MEKGGFTVSTAKRQIRFVAPTNMQMSLTVLKQERYSGTTTDAMLADLIRIGLAAAASQNKSDSAAQNPQS